MASPMAESNTRPMKLRSGFARMLRHTLLSSIGSTLSDIDSGEPGPSFFTVKVVAFVKTGDWVNQILE